MGLAELAKSGERPKNTAGECNERENGGFFVLLGFYTTLGFARLHPRGLRGFVVHYLGRIRLCPFRGWFFGLTGTVHIARNFVPVTFVDELVRDFAEPDYVSSLVDVVSY